MNSGKIILDLCGGTGSWSKPYKEAGYDVRIITLSKHDVREFVPPFNVYGILAAPPCKEFSIAKNQKLKRDFQVAMILVNACVNISMTCGPQFFALENPVGHLSDFLGTPRYIFQPWWFGDPWTKKTALWGRFNEPKRLYQRWDDVPKNGNLYVRSQRKKPSIAFLHKSAVENIPQLREYQPKTDADFRAITPPGFARAFFEANP